MPGDRVKLLGFSRAVAAAKTAAAKTAPAKAAPGRPIEGEPTRFLAPEILRGEAADARADVYGVAALLASLLTGDAPFPVAETPDAVAARPVLDPNALRAGRTALPAALRGALARALAPVAADRQATMAELAAELDKSAEALNRSGWWRWLSR
jgi:serine/threonine-protein kinase